MSLAEAVNQSTSNVAEPIAVHGGDSAITFDDLERVSDLPSQDSPKKEKPAKEAKEPKEPKESKTKEAQDGEEESSSKKTSSKEEVKESDAKESASVKTLKVKNGDQDVDLRADTLIDVKINGKIEKVPLQDVLNGFSGQSHLTREAQKLKGEKESFTKQRENVLSAVNHVHDLIVNQQSPREAMYYLAEAVGGDPEKIWSDTVSKIKEAIEAQQSLSPEERRARELEEELSFVKTRSKKQEEHKAREAKNAETQAHVSKVKEEFGLDDETYESAVQDILSLGKLPKEQITPELVGQYTKLVKQHEKLGSLLDEVHAAPESRSKDMKDLADIWKNNPDFNEEDMRQIAVEVYGTDSAKRLSKKVNKMEKNMSKKMVNKDPQKDPSFFDELT